MWPKVPAVCHNGVMVYHSILIPWRLSKTCSSYLYLCTGTVLAGTGVVWLKVTHSVTCVTPYLLRILGLLLGMHGLLLLRLHGLPLRLHHLPCIMVCFQMLKKMGKFTIITLTSSQHTKSTRMKWWKQSHPEIVKPMNHETPVLNMQKFINGRKHNHLAVGRCTNKWRLIRNEMKMSIVSTILPAGV